MEADVESSSENRNNILYDFTIQTEWQQDPEVFFRGSRERSVSLVSIGGHLSTRAASLLWKLLQTVHFPIRNGAPCMLPKNLIKLVSSQMNWHFDVSRDGHHVVVLQDDSIEIRTWKDDFSNCVSKWTIPRDASPQWRIVTWSPDADMIAYANSSGAVSVFDIMGTSICFVESVHTPNPNAPADLSCAVCALIFKEPHNKQNWDYELLVINYQGILKNYAISQSGEYSLLNTFSFSTHYVDGISTVAYSPVHSLLFVGGGAEPVGQRDTETPTATQLGITAWRILSDIPHYKLVTDYDDTQMAQRRIRLLKMVRSLYQWKNEEKDGIYKLCLSPNYQIIAAIHHSGSLTLLDVPSLRIRRTWQQEEQPGYNEVDQTIAENPKLRKAYKEQLTAFYLTDINWWSDQELILARGTGAVTVSCVKTLKNLLGMSPEWFKGTPLLSMSNGTGFLGLECESKYSQLKRIRNESEDEYEDSEDEEDVTLVTRTRKFIRQALYFVTDNEQFQPPRKRPKIVTRTYRLVYLKSTTPEELYTRKIENEEYGEALALAKAYGLDCDLVYQRQWRKSPVSVASIQDYLSKISKRSWVLRECLERVPVNIDAMRELLHYGLRGTDLEALLAIGRGEDGGRFILCDRSSVYAENIDVFNTEAVEAAKADERQYVEDLLNQVDFSNLTLEQKELCRARSKLVQYHNRLLTYEEVLGGAHYAPERYDAKFFESFRSKNIVEVATQYAQDCDWQALEIIFTYHGKDTLPHRLAILTQFLETYDPDNYKSLLPGIDPNLGKIQTWPEQSWREPDWCELPQCKSVIDPEPVDPGAFLYEANQELVKFKGTDVSTENVTEWYKYRACQIEEFCRLVDLALSLITIAREEKHIPGLDDLYDDLITMDTLVYECLVDESLTFQHMLDMPDIDRLRLMMSRSSKEMYAKNIRRWLMPFLQRCERKKPGSFLSLIQEYLVSMAKEDLTLCVVVFQCCRLDQPNPIINDEGAVISMALECIYACESNDQLSNAYSILGCLPCSAPAAMQENLAVLHESINQLNCHLSAAKILEKHELPQTIAYIRDSQNNEEEAVALFTKLTRKAGRRDPRLTEKQWKELLADVLMLREKVYRCVESAVCYQIFVESLLCSSDLKNIQLAGEMMERNAVEGREPDYNIPDSDNGLVTERVQYKIAIQLVLQAAREYFDSSTNLTDSSMDLARACLNLIDDIPLPIQEELDLIDALALLDGFGVSILPLQVRMCKDKLQLIQQALEARSYTYKNSQRLLRLGRLLRLPGDNDVEKDGQVLQLVAKMALKMNDIKVCYETCQTLMEMGYPSIWTECKSLAQKDEFRDIPAKMELLSYALTHCTPDMIEPILKAKCLLETQIMYEHVHNKMADRESLSPVENPFSAKGAIQQTKEILSSTNKATRKVLSNVSNKSWWKKTLKSMKPMRPVRYVSQSDDLNEDFSHQGIHPFYESIMDNCYVNRSEVDYERLTYSRPDLNGLHFTEGLLYASKLEETLSEGDRYQPSVEVLHQLANDSLAVDSTLGLSYLLALPDAIDAEKTLDKHTESAISLQLAAYYYAIQIYSQLDPTTPPHVKPVYHYAPMELVQKMLSHTKWVEAEKTARWNDEVKALIQKLRHYNELLMDYNQAEALKQLDRGIDIGRFAVDPEYKKETILGLSMTTDNHMYEVSVSLAKRYGVPLWDVYMGHLEYLFDSGLTTDEIQSRITELDLLTTLQEEKERFVERMARYVYPGIDGKDHDRLYLYYGMLENCPTEDPITPNTHIKLLKRVKHAAPGLDYKSLTDGEHDPLEVLMPVLTYENINALVKVASKLPDKHGGFIQPSLVYCGWAIQNFWNAKQKPGKEKVEWIHRYESCSDYLEKLLPEDVIRFLDAITFVPEATEELAADCRRQIVRRALKYSRQQLAAAKKKPASVQGSITWNQVVQHMQQSLEHLDKLNNPVIVSMRQSEDPQLQAYAKEFDLSRSEQEKLEQLYVKMALDGQSPEMINDLITTSKLTKLSTRTVFKKAVQFLIDAFRNKDTASCLLQNRDIIEVLKVIIEQVGQHQQHSGDLISSEDLMELLRCFCADSSVPVDTRLQVLTVMEQCFSLQGEDLVLLILYRTDAVVSTAWNDKHITADDVSSEKTRCELFQTLLEDSEQIEQFNALINLLQVWPALPTSSAKEPDINVWCQLLSKMVQKCGQSCAAAVLSTVRQLLQEKQLSDELICFLHEVLLEHDMPLVAVKCLLMSEDTSMHQKAVDILAQQTQSEDEDDELFILLLQRHLTASMVNTVFYTSLIGYVLANQVQDGTEPYYLSVETIANQLQAAGYEAEAGSLLLTRRGTHRALRTFDAALGYLNRWLTR